MSGWRWVERPGMAALAFGCISHNGLPTPDPRLAGWRRAEWPVARGGLLWDLATSMVMKTYIGLGATSRTWRISPPI